MRALLLALVVLLAGCAAPEDAPASGAPRLETAALVTSKDTFRVPAPEAPSPLAPVLGAPAAFAHELDIPRETGRLHLALDVAGEGRTQFRLVSGGRLLATEEIEGGGKLVVLVDTPPGGPARLEVANEGPVEVGLVATSFPAGYQPGKVVTVAFPEQTEIDHSFRPARVALAAHEPPRITLFDYDPHAGVENLQHNLAFPALGAKTEGRTTWGEARVLDFDRPAPGEYRFVCEFHGFEGVLVVE